MKPIMKLTILLIILLIPTLAISAHVSKGSLYKFMDVSGINKQVAELPSMLQAGLQQGRQQQQQKLPEQLFTAIVDASAKAFDPKPFLAHIGNEIRVGITEGDAITLIRWYETPLGKEIVATEVAASNPTALQDMLANAQTLMADDEMMAKARKIDRLVGATDMVIELQSKIALATFTAGATAQNPGQKVDIAGFKKQMNAQSQQIRTNSEMTILLSFVYTYKDLDPVKLDKYIAFLTTPEMQKANASVQNGMTAAFIKSINHMAKELKSTLRK